VEVLRKPMKNIIQDIRSPERDLNLGTPENENGDVHWNHCNVGPGGGRPEFATR
jgi:hypothetical protein